MQRLPSSRNKCFKFFNAIWENHQVDYRAMYKLELISLKFIQKLA